MPPLQAFIFIGALFVVVNYAYRGCRAGTAGTVIGVEDQTALAGKTT